MRAVAAAYGGGSAYGVDFDPNESLRWYRRAAEAGSTGAMEYLGEEYAFGTHVPVDRAESMKWYRRAADAGSPQAMTMLGSLYRKSGQYAEALRWYFQAAGGLRRRDGRYRPTV